MALLDKGLDLFVSNAEAEIFSHSIQGLNFGPLYMTRDMEVRSFMLVTVNRTRRAPTRGGAVTVLLRSKSLDTP